MGVGSTTLPGPSFLDTIHILCAKTALSRVDASDGMHGWRGKRVTPPTNTFISLGNNAIHTPSTFGNAAGPAPPHRSKTNTENGERNEFILPAAESIPLQRRKANAKNRNRKEFVLPTAESIPLTSRVFEILTFHTAKFILSDEKLPLLEHLHALVQNWSAMLFDSHGMVLNAQNGADVDGNDVDDEGRTDVRKVIYVIILVAIHVLYKEGVTKSDLESAISPFFAKHKYHKGEGNWRQINAAVKYIQEIFRYVTTIGNSAFAIPFLRLQESYLGDYTPFLQMPQFEWARPAILVYMLLGGVKSPIPFIKIVENLEPEPWPQRLYSFFPCLPERCDDPLFSERIGEAAGVAAFACSVGLDISSQPQLVETITLPPNTQWCPSPIQVAIVLYAAYPPDVILGEDGSEVSKWYPGFALLLHTISLRVTTRSKLHTMVWNGKKRIEGTADR
ncbi:hypothetical protein PWT90_07462 [Aphanocladium album]|nr:hypothetical protein PWT90_07462 [Aphanocladium album]